MKQRRTAGESAKSVREQVFMWRYKSEPSTVESSVSKSSACCRYCQSCPWSVAKNWEKMKMFFFFFIKKKKRCIWLLPVYLPPSLSQVVSEMAVICVFASFPGSGCSEMAVTCVFVSFPDRWLLPVCLPPSLTDGCYLCFCLLPWVRLFGGGCYLCFCLFPWQRWLLPVFLPPSLTEVAVISCLRPSMNQVIQTPRWLLPVFLPPSLRLS